jgi:Tol biopolymer transport system component
LTAAHNGERVAWVFDLRGARNVWVADGPDFAARQVTHYTGDDGMPIASLKLTPDGNTIVYARGSETNDQGEVADPTSNVSQPQQQVWAAEVAGGEPRLLGTMNCSFEGCEDIEISPDGQYAGATSCGSRQFPAKKQRASWLISAAIIPIPNGRLMAKRSLSSAIAARTP